LMEVTVCGKPIKCWKKTRPYFCHSILHRARVLL